MATEGDSARDEKERARMQYGDEDSFASRLERYFIENRNTSVKFRVLNLFLKLATCILYCYRVTTECRSCLPVDVARADSTWIEWVYGYYPPSLAWIYRDYDLYVLQTAVATMSFFMSAINFWLTHKGGFHRIFVSIFVIELITSVPLFVAMFYERWQFVYVPIFLNCWLANKVLDDLLHDLHRISRMTHSILFRQFLSLLVTVICLVFTGTCVIEHLERAGPQPETINLFSSFYFVMVTFSTVGYGDVYPTVWQSRLAVIILLIVALWVLPSKVEALAQTMIERSKAGSNYTRAFAYGESHVVVTITHLEADFIEDFLNEFYAQPNHEHLHVVLLSPHELDPRMRLLLKIPLWSSRVFYVRGSALKDEDLERVQMADAKACFILSARHVRKKSESDEQTILRSWAVKDFAPHVPQYVQVFRPETKMHIEHAEIVICEDEFKYSLLANNCICPGISTFVTLLMHTSRGEEGQKSTEAWQRVYGFHSGNEIYDIRLADSKFFGEYVGKSFTYASFHSHQSYGVCLVGVKPDGTNARILLNPGQNYIMKGSDRLYYIALTNEESLSEFKKTTKKSGISSTIANIGTVALELPQEIVDAETPGRLRWKRKRKLLKQSKNLTTGDGQNLISPKSDANLQQHRASIGVVTDSMRDQSFDEGDEDYSNCVICTGRCVADGMVKTYPPINAYVHAHTTVCHILKEKREFCCLEIDKRCVHSDRKSPHDFKWRTPALIVAADRTSSGLVNLLLPLRAYYRPVHDLHPIILLLELENDAKPHDAFLDLIAWFPHVYWLPGRISSLDNLLKAGIFLAEHVIVVKESAALESDYLADCSTILTVQKIHRMFPKLRLISELTHSTNMRFMEFDAQDAYALQQSKVEKRERSRGSNLAFMFRLPFAAGNVFSAHMLDRLLYQAFDKNYLVSFLKMFLGIDQSPGSGYLSSFKVVKEDAWIGTYGRLYQQLCSTVADIPIGIYRTMPTGNLQMATSDEETSRASHPSLRNRGFSQLVFQRMNSLGIPQEEYKVESGTRDKGISFVIINPPADLHLQEGDVVYVLRAPVSEKAKNRRANPRFGLRRQSVISERTPLMNVYSET